MSTKNRNVVAMAVLVAGLLVAGRSMAGSLDPTNAPGPTMHTLEEIYQKQADTYQKVDAFVSPQTLSNTTAVVQAGYYAATTLPAVDTDLTADNIKTNVTIFGIVGTLSTNTGSAYPAAVPKTGQTTQYQTGDDGTYQKGVASPSPRFTVGTGTSSNCVTDNLTGLMWLKNPDATARDWTTAITYCEGLDGTSGRGGYTDWRLPNVKELQSLIDFKNRNPALPSGHPFTGVQSGYYWSSTSHAASTDDAWDVDLYDGNVHAGNKTLTLYVWPVRGGQ